jgi:hypothetical protein
MTMTVRKMIARYNGECQACPEPVRPGQEINFGGRGAVTHAECGPPEPVTTPARRSRGRGRGSKYGYTSSGARVTDRYRRCEDAPCCGCCD